MKATFNYSGEEACQIVLEHHSKQFPAPAGIGWEAHSTSYASEAVTVEAVEKIPDDALAERPRPSQ